MLKRSLFVFIAGLSMPSHSAAATSNNIKNTAKLKRKEKNIAKKLSHFAEKGRDDYNRNNLGGTRRIISGNDKHTKRVSKVDSNMLTLCPRRLSVIEQQSKTTVLSTRPTVIEK